MLNIYVIIYTYPDQAMYIVSAATQKQASDLVHTECPHLNPEKDTNCTITMLTGIDTPHILADRYDIGW